MAFSTSGLIGFVSELTSVALLGFWAVLIRWMTPEPSALPLIKRPRLESALVLLAFMFITHLLDSGVVRVEPWHALSERADRWIAAAAFSPVRLWRSERSLTRPVCGYVQ